MLNFTTRGSLSGLVVSYRLFQGQNCLLDVKTRNSKTHWFYSQHCTERSSLLQLQKRVQHNTVLYITEQHSTLLSPSQKKSTFQEVQMLRTAKKTVCHFLQNPRWPPYLKLKFSSQYLMRGSPTHKKSAFQVVCLLKNRCFLQFFKNP